MARPRLAVVIGSVRPNRFADHPAHWIAELARERGDFEVEVVDLKDYPLPLFDEPSSPAYGPSQGDVAQRWRAKMAGFDAYIFTAAEYNRGPTAALKNALDHAYPEWNNKPVGFVGYGGVGGARAVEQLRLNAVELQMAPIRNGVHIQWPVYAAVAQEGKTLRDFDFLNQTGRDMLEQLSWWTRALKAARERSDRALAA
jgi:NAD(P)H-dependent FMN reductase